MKELIEYIAKSIVSYPDDVVVSSSEKDDGDVAYILQVHPDDKGRVIGRQGRVAQSIRSLLRVAAIKNGLHVSLEIE
ncbi:MAG TPA: KH domain-containing protein [SAR202 cluster bacterium]|jgi:hypothetical protein|nr:KH domain-containing protein [SAR202 cluster bacterium]|tara:strand:+ start:36452 stop:36682 length:231 start_codon:yes stop_codon:yes gene_type:complete